MGYWGIANGVIGSAELADGSIVAIDLCDGAVTTCKLANGAVTDMKIDAHAVQTVHIADNAIVAAHIGTGQVFGIHISDGQVGNAHLLSGSITGGKLSYAGSGFDFAGKVRTCGTAGFVVRDGAGCAECGGLRYCGPACVLQFYNGSWQSITASGYLLGTDFHLPTSHAYCGDGELWWDTYFYRPAFYCSGSTYCLATYDEFDSLCGTVGDLCSSMGSAWSCISDLYCCVASNCSRIDSLESGSFYQLGEPFCLPTSYYGSSDGEMYWDSCEYRPAYVCSYSSYRLWALDTPLTVPTCYCQVNGGLRWCTSTSKVQVYCNGTWYPLH